MSNWDQYDNKMDLACALWTHVLSEPSADLPLHRFRALFAHIYENCSDIPVLWQLGGATNDYLRHHPDALTVPTELPATLLNSDDVQARVIGLKLLNRCNVTDEMIVTEIIRAIERGDRYESYGGFHELNAFLDRQRADGYAIVDDLILQLRNVLASLVDDQDDVTRSSARRLLERLGTL